MSTSGDAADTMAARARLLAGNDVVRYVNDKFGIRTPARELVHVDPYHRFFRIIERLQRSAVLPASDDTWLDLGCHHGQFMTLLASFCSARWVGVDDWDLKAAMPEAPFEYLAADLASASWTEHFRPHSVRFVSALEVIEHMTDTDAFLERIRTVARADAYLILSTPNINSLRNRVRVPMGDYPAYLEYRNIIHHVRLFNRETLTTLLRAHGFAVIDCVGVSFFPERWLRVAVLRRLSEFLADRLPSLCGNLIVLARRVD